MEETREAEAPHTVERELASPQGVGMAVAFDWGLAVQVFIMPIVAVAFGQPVALKTTSAGSLLVTGLFFIGAWLAAALLVWFGELVRSGRNPARLVQIVANILLTLGGLFALVHLYQSIRMDNFWPLVTEVILLIFSPLIAWRMSRPRSARWFQVISASAARERHGGRWVWFIALWAIAGGVLQTIAVLK